MPAEVRLYNPLFTRPDPDAGEFRRRPQSEVAGSAGRMPGSSRRSRRGNAGEPVQFERQGYFCRDRDSTPGRPVFNRTVGLRDTWAKVGRRQGLIAQIAARG